MKRIPPSQRIGRRINELLSLGLEGEEDVTASDLIVFGGRPDTPDHGKKNEKAVAET